jgi:putative membrane-bound dehydrogenase-like protein
VFTHSNVGRPGARDAERSPLNAAVWRYHPTKKLFEVFAEGMSNQWGLDFNDVGDAFVTACVIPHLYHVVQGGHYHRQAGQHFNPFVYGDIKTIADHFHYDRGVAWSDARFGAGGTDAAGGGHAHAGTLIYLGDNFPEEYRGALFTHNVLGSRINREQLRSNGSGYIGSHRPDFMRANDAWFRGLRLETGPDGSLFNSDWYDARACHQQHPQDRTNGRIYKISYGDPKPVMIDLAALGPRGLLLTNPPYGMRVSDGADLRGLYARLGDVLRAGGPGWHLGLLVPHDRALAGQLRLRLTPAVHTTNGGLPVELLLTPQARK